MGVVMIIAIALPVILALSVIGYVVYWYIHNKEQPVTDVQARVIRKRTKNWDVSVVGDTPEMQAARTGLLGSDPKGAAKALLKSAESPDVPEITFASGTDFYVTFGFEDKEEELQVPEFTYVAVDEGTEGLLVYQGELFKHFITSLPNK
jgi:hypothetical protein